MWGPPWLEVFYKRGGGVMNRDVSQYFARQQWCGELDRLDPRVFVSDHDMDLRLVDANDVNGVQINSVFCGYDVFYTCDTECNYVSSDNSLTFDQNIKKLPCDEQVLVSGGNCPPLGQPGYTMDAKSVCDYGCNYRYVGQNNSTLYAIQELQERSMGLLVVVNDKSHAIESQLYGRNSFDMLIDNSFNKFVANDQVFQSGAIHPRCVYYPKQLNYNLGFKQIGNARFRPVFNDSKLNGPEGSNYLDVIK